MYMAAASCAHIAVYWASVAAMAEVFGQEVGGDQRHQLGAVGRDRRWGHGDGERCLVGRGRRVGLAVGSSGLGRAGLQPRDIGAGLCHPDYSVLPNRSLVQAAIRSDRMQISFAIARGAITPIA